MRRVDYLMGEADFSRLTADQFMQQDVIYFSKAVKGEQIAAALTTGGFGSLPIVDGDLKPIGIVSEFDLLRAIRNGKDLHKTTAEELMTQPVLTIQYDAPAPRIMEILEDRHLIRLPVIDRGGKLVGIVARRDILQGYLRSQSGQIVWWM